ncbi:hypothetical protein VNO77_31429 [Canavalia gladiata]|uniref:Uncharacterized protein n=1 Tax=Canavalia gladiata TaxID=3824 RepID=A0AAN9KPM6_CANGL
MGVVWDKENYPTTTICGKNCGSVRAPEDHSPLCKKRRLPPVLLGEPDNQVVEEKPCWDERPPKIEKKFRSRLRTTYVSCKRLNHKRKEGNALLIEARVHQHEHSTDLITVNSCNEVLCGNLFVVDGQGMVLVDIKSWSLPFLTMTIRFLFEEMGDEIRNESVRIHEANKLWFRSIALSRVKLSGSIKTPVIFNWHQGISTNSLYSQKRPIKVPIKAFGSATSMVDQKAWFSILTNIPRSFGSQGVEDPLPTSSRLSANFRLLTIVHVQKQFAPSAEPCCYCGTQDLNSAHQSFARLHSGFFEIPRVLSIVQLLGVPIITLA